MEGRESSKKMKMDSVPEKGKEENNRKQFTLKVSCTENFHRYKPTRGEGPSFRLPAILGCFSIDENREFQNHDRQRKFIVVPKNKIVAWDLNKGYDSAIRKDRKLMQNEKLDNFLHYILANRDHVIKNFSSEVKPSVGFGAKFVCCRGLLTKLLTTINKTAHDWCIAATKFNGTIYLCEFLTESERRRLENTTPDQDRMRYWGFKFETYMTTDNLEKPPDVEAVLNENLEFWVTYKGGVGDHRILFGAEVDGIDSCCADEKRSPKFLELKTSKLISSDCKDWPFPFRKHKLCEWWAQSYTVNIPTIICGFRDEKGIVRKLEEFDTQSLPAKSQGVWDPIKAIKFCEEFLTFVETHVEKDDPNIVYKMFWERGKDVTLEELLPPHEYHILPEWYTSAWQ